MVLGLFPLSSIVLGVAVNQPSQAMFFALFESAFVNISIKNQSPNAIRFPALVDLAKVRTDDPMIWLENYWLVSFVWYLVGPNHARQIDRSHFFPLAKGTWRKALWFCFEQDKEI